MAWVQQHKFLGIIIHENLSQKRHITTVCDKVAKVRQIFSKSGRYLPSVTVKALYNSLFYLISTIIILSGHLHMPPTLNLFIYSKRKPFVLSPFLFHEHVLNLLSLSLIFFLFIDSINSMFLPLYSHILITFYLPLFPCSSTLIVIFMLIQLVLVLTYIKFPLGIHLLVVLKPQLFGIISP